MKDSPNYFKMNPGSKEVDSPGTFKNTASVLNMGSPVNYTEGDDKKKKETKEERGKRVYEAAMARVKAQKAQSEAKKKMPKQKSILPRITTGMGTSFTTYND